MPSVADVNKNLWTFASDLFIYIFLSTFLKHISHVTNLFCNSVFEARFLH